MVSVLKRTIMKNLCPRYAVQSERPKWYLPVGNKPQRFTHLDGITEHGWMKASVNIKQEKVPSICSLGGIPKGKVIICTAKGEVSFSCWLSDIGYLKISCLPVLMKLLLTQKIIILSTIDWICGNELFQFAASLKLCMLFLPQKHLLQKSFDLPHQVKLDLLKRVFWQLQEASLAGVYPFLGEVNEQFCE